MNLTSSIFVSTTVSAGCHINDVMNFPKRKLDKYTVSAGCHINDVMNNLLMKC